MASIRNDWLYTPMVGVKVMSETGPPDKYFYNRQFFTDSDRRNKLFFDNLDDAYLAINSKSVDCIKIASLLSEKPMSPYRQLATVEKEEVKPKRTGLLVAEVPHKCNPPKTYIDVTIKKELFGLLKRKIKVQREVTENSLYRCPECLKVFRYESGLYWSSLPSYKIEWQERTGELE